LFHQDQLLVDFPDIPKTYLTITLAANNMLYAPSYFALLAERKKGPPFPYTPIKSLRRSKTKGKARAVEDYHFAIERLWLLEQLEKAETGEAQPVEDGCAEGEGIECGCCFTDHPFVGPFSPPLKEGSD
jgi:E3 ubiquitin-protein ligase RNF216